MPLLNTPVPGAREFYPLNEPEIGTALSQKVRGSQFTVVSVQFTLLCRKGCSSSLPTDYHRRCDLQEQNLRGTLGLVQRHQQRARTKGP